MEGFNWLEAVVHLEAAGEAVLLEAGEAVPSGAAGEAAL